MYELYQSFMSEVVLPFYPLSIKYLLTPYKGNHLTRTKKNDDLWQNSQ